jgi:hypothetical protein
VAHRGPCGEAAAAIPENRKVTLTATFPPYFSFSSFKLLDLKSIHYFCFTIEVLFFLV